MKSQPFQTEVRKYLCHDRKADVGGRGAEKSRRDLCNQPAYSEWYHILEREWAAYALTLLCFHDAFRCQQSREITLAICVTTIQ